MRRSMACDPFSKARPSLTGLGRPLRMSHETMAQRIKMDLERKLGLFSAGLAPTNVMAKIALKYQKLMISLIFQIQ